MCLKWLQNVNDASKAWSHPKISSLYEKTRPDYNLDSVKYLLEKVGALKKHSDLEPFTIVELGAGTGKFTRAVLKVLKQHNVENFKIISTEPLKSMCDKFKEMVPEVEIIQCSASDLSDFPDHMIDTVLAAQCFHWLYSEEKAIKEIHRILKPLGTLGLIFYYPDRSVPWIRSIEEMLDPKYTAVGQINTYDEKILTPLLNVGFCEVASDVSAFMCCQELDRKDLMERYKTKSVVSASNQDEKMRILEAIEEILTTNANTKYDGKYFFDYVMKIHCFQKF
ncbi:uncharacterized methyltransferase C25B8.09-like [Xenia sp. Carnegie-2017]|uniref:uncharacterized methyltransferase C25B8.09-like n=1 Tax=Xenia sp. Carnegie-2017 TaxID=2897299 RepID=UPI001F03AE73|nr:uncharacterized methyltransferase C25B8.09-like [Xenia sp. Carnegie-2017]